MLLSGNKKKNNYRSLRPFLAEHVKYNYSISLIPSFIDKIQSLEQENQHLRSANGIGSVSYQLNSVNSKIDLLISQQKDGWAHDRFNALSSQMQHLTSQQRDGWAHDRFQALYNKIDSLHEEKGNRYLRRIINKIKKII